MAQGRSLRSICQKRYMPSTKAVIQWTAETDSPFGARYARAREQQADALAEEIIAIADEAKDYDSDGIQAARLRVDARKWIASKILPKKWGEKPAEFRAGDVIVHNHISVERQKELQARKEAALAR